MDQHLDMRAHFARSMERLLVHPTFIEAFYRRFLSAGPTIAEKFTATDMKRQVGMMRASLYQILRAAQGIEEGTLHLTELGASHRARHGVGREDYVHWLDALVGAAREVDPAFDATTEAAVRFYLGEAITHMTR